MPAKPSAKPNTAITIDTRCKYVAASGRRCKSPAARDTHRASGYSAFCLPHSQMEQQYLDAESVAEELIGNVNDFRTQLAINQILGRLLVIVAQNRMPLRNATAVAYICQLLLTSSVGVRYEFHVRNPTEGERFLVNRAMDMLYDQPRKTEPEGEEEDDEEEDDAGPGKPAKKT